MRSYCGTKQKTAEGRVLCGRSWCVLTYYTELAIALVAGRHGSCVVRFYPERERLSRDTKPSEEDARRALLCTLGEIRRQLADKRLQQFLSILAVAFVEDPRALGGRADYFPHKLIVKKRSTGHADPIRDYDIAALVQHLRNKGKTRTLALNEAADACGRDWRTVEKIYDRKRRKHTRNR